MDCVAPQLLDPQTQSSEVMSVSCTETSCSPAEVLSRTDAGHKQKNSVCNGRRKKRKATKSRSRQRPQELSRSPDGGLCPGLTEEEPRAGTEVVAWRKLKKWQQGQLLEIRTLGNGRTKYKVMFEKKQKVLVSGHHVAFGRSAAPKQLCVGSRVVVRSQDDNAWFGPGILAELPNRNNHHRFLVVPDGRVPVYVDSSSLHLVFRQFLTEEDETEELQERISKKSGDTGEAPSPSSCESISSDADVKRADASGSSARTAILSSLPEYKLAGIRPPTPEQFYSEDDSESSEDSDSQRDLDDDSGRSRRRKRRKVQRSDGRQRPPELGHASNEATAPRPNLPVEELIVGTAVVAMRRRRTTWRRGQLVEIRTLEDGRMKYKVRFENREKVLMSGHHIGFDKTPAVEQLYVGARVIAPTQADKAAFAPGILAELPSRKNRHRFLVFADDHTPAYVGLPSLRLVYKPLKEPLDDISNLAHRIFLKAYLSHWPYPRMSLYNIGQVIIAECHGVLKSCEVQAVDCSLILVVFQDDQHEEWFYRGSIRLQPLVGCLEVKKPCEADAS
ncbi:uncharacterized protein LOC143004348 isoform X2 [Genypterus blacodes]|uniref:uncharacterized protein LOC143004348 isoform X2 n=1 Tax=Genypterus blacodes TaxID=154954 RepID=UPI003F763CFF